jgi:hypothetical protein
MATRFYFPLDQAAPVTPPSPAAEWEHNNGVTRALLVTPDGSTLTTTAYTPDGADDLTNRDSMHRQYVSDPLGPQTITGNVSGQFQCLEAHANNNLFILLINTTGDTTRATLLAITRATSLELATSLTNRTFPSTALTSTVVTPGDRLVIEVGLGGNITTAAGGVQGHNGSIRWGCSAAGGDLAANETETGTTFRPWLEFTNTVLFHAPEIAMARGIPVGGRA